MNNTLSKKVIVLGVDGMDPRLTRKYVDKGLMPNLEKYLEKGAAREDLVLLGAHPTITPPMWTTLSTGAYPVTHGITCFWSQHPTKIDTFKYANDSRNCLAEQLWDVTAEAGKKTLVWHWPGCSWPPTSNSSNLHVIEGTQPSAINYGIGLVDGRNHFYYVDEKYANVEEHDFKGVKVQGAGCIVDDMEVAEDDPGDAGNVMKSLSVPEPQPISMNPYEGECQNYGKDDPFYTEIPLKPAQGWLEQREGDKEFSIALCDGKVRRVGLFRKNSEGIYDTVELYKTKKDLQPLVKLKSDEYVLTSYDELIDANDEKVIITRSYTIVDVDPQGKSFKFWFGNANRTGCDTLFSPKHLYKDIVENVGYVPSVELGTNLSAHPDLLLKIMHRSWRYYGDWQAAAINYLIKQENYEVVFSHYHNIDNFGHCFWEHHKAFGNMAREEEYEKLFEQVYIDTDRYLGDFLYL